MNGLILPDDERCKGELKEFRKCDYTPPQEPVRRTVDYNLEPSLEVDITNFVLKNIAPPSPRSLGRRR